jgi:large conductance mechanosensitive channel
MTDRISTGLHGAGRRVQGTAKVFQGFKDFISRGNAIELAVGVVIGAAFGAVVTSIVNGLIGPLIAAIFGKQDLSGTLSWTWNGAVFSIGLILQALILFLITAAAIYFFVVLPLNALANRRKRGLEEEPAAPAEDILLLQEIRDLLAARPSRAVVNDAGADHPDAGSAGRPGPFPPSIPPAT